MTDSHAGVKWHKYMDTMTGCKAKWPSWNRRNSGAKVIESATSSQWHSIMTSGSSCSKHLITLKFSCLNSPEFNFSKVLFHFLFPTKKKRMGNFTFPKSYYWGFKFFGNSRCLFTSSHGATWNRTWNLKKRKLILTLSLHSFQTRTQNYKVAVSLVTELPLGAPRSKLATVKLEGRQGKFHKSKLCDVTQMGKMVCGNEESINVTAPSEQFKFETSRTR